MEDKLKELSALLQEEVALHESLKADLDLEVTQDGKLDGSELLRLQQHKNALVRRINELEQDRMSVVKALARGWNEAPETLTLRRIIPKAPDALGEELKASYVSLMNLVNGIRALAKSSGGNAAARLKAVDATLSIIHEAVKVHSTYSGQGKLQAPPVSLKYTSV